MACTMDPSEASTAVHHMELWQVALWLLWRVGADCQKMTSCHSASSLPTSDGLKYTPSWWDKKAFILTKTCYICTSRKALWWQLLLLIWYMHSTYNLLIHTHCLHTSLSSMHVVLYPFYGKWWHSAGKAVAICIEIFMQLMDTTKSTSTTIQPSYISAGSCEPVCMQRIGSATAPLTCSCSCAAQYI